MVPVEPIPLPRLNSQSPLVLTHKHQNVKTAVYSQILNHFIIYLFFLHFKLKFLRIAPFNFHLDAYYTQTRQFKEGDRRRLNSSSRASCRLNEESERR